MLPIFIYLPPEAEKRGRFLNLSLIADIEEMELKNGLLLWGACGEEIAKITGEQANVLRRHLMGRSLSHHPEPELPRIPDPMIVPPAVTEFEEKLSARGTVA